MNDDPWMRRDATITSKRTSHGSAILEEGEPLQIGSGEDSKVATCQKSPAVRVRAYGPFMRFRRRRCQIKEFAYLSPLGRCNSGARALVTLGCHVPRVYGVHLHGAARLSKLSATAG